MTVLTLHILQSIPWSNLNRDDTGTPKRTTQGGVLRGMLSSQSLKRAARVRFENATLEADRSVRSVNLHAIVADRAITLNPDLDKKVADRDAKKLIGSLTKGSKAPADAEADETSGAASDSNRSAWLSMEELETAANLVAGGDSAGTFVDQGRTGSLAIAGFGRMFANAPSFTTEAAIAVSPAISTHRAEIDVDYFSTVDDAPSESQGAGASYLGLAQFTSGVFYRSITIDRDELKRTWTGFGGENARPLLELFVDSLLGQLPRGKKNATAPYTMPLAILAEEQRHRVAYDFEIPVEPDYAAEGDGGGYTAPSIAALVDQRAKAVAFDPANFDGLAVAGGVSDISGFDDSVTRTDRAGIVAAVVDWIQA